MQGQNHIKVIVQTDVRFPKWSRR